MAQQLSEIKGRIKSVSSSLQITKAMKLVSSVKVTRYRQKILSNRHFIEELESITKSLLSVCLEKDTPYLQENKGVKGNLYLLVTSSLGLCGAYNTNLFKFADSIFTPDDEVIILGSKGLGHYQNTNLNINTSFGDYNSSEEGEKVLKITNYLVDSFRNKKCKEVHIIFTHYKNSITFNPVDFLLLPLPKTTRKDSDPEIIFEPSKKVLVERLVPLYLNSSINTKLMEAELSEHASRTQAMDNATQNAEDILDDLSLEYNKARQGKITEEITEIVAASSDK
ncbi:MAG: ATP synthase F1 subunit gamma [Coprobacillus sp.]|nr:ATP synthase F1 subunit gamma [Coprobacillus sp.]